MSSSAGQTALEKEVLALVYELLDAHADTIEMAGGLAEEWPWQIHLDYLRALQRKAREIVARWYSSSQRVGAR